MLTGQHYTWKFDGFYKDVKCEFEITGPDLSSYTAQLAIEGKYGDDVVISPESARLVIKVPL